MKIYSDYLTNLSSAAAEIRKIKAQLYEDISDVRETDSNLIFPEEITHFFTSLYNLIIESYGGRASGYGTRLSGTITFDDFTTAFNFETPAHGTISGMYKGTFMGEVRNLMKEANLQKVEFVSSPISFNGKYLPLTVKVYRDEIDSIPEFRCFDLLGIM